MRKIRVPGVPSNLTLAVLWIVASAIPMGPYTVPLFQGSLSDSPRAYLVWIPIMAFGWGLWNLQQGMVSPKGDKTPARRMLGIPLMVITGFFLVVGRFLSPEVFLGADIGLLLWPIWSLGLCWVLFGLGGTSKVVAPLTYLLLVWPPVFQMILSVVNPPLHGLATSAFRWLAHQVPWMHPGVQSDVIDVTWGHQMLTHVSITQACSGSDSILALFILFPVVLVLFPIRPHIKALLVVIGTVLAFLENFIRIGIILWGLHLFGYRFAFDVLHPVLGAVLFLLIAVLLLVFGTRTQIRRSAGSKHALQAPRTGLIITALALSMVVTAFLAPLYTFRPGSALRPKSMDTQNLMTLLPVLPGYTVQRAGADKPSTSGESGSQVHYVSSSHADGLGVALSWAGTGIPGSSGTKVPSPRPVLPTDGKVIRQQEVWIQSGIPGTTYQFASGEHALIFTYAVVYHYQRANVMVSVQLPATSDHASAQRQAATLKAFEREFGQGP